MDFDTRSFAERERFDAFATIACSTYVKHDCLRYDPRPFAATVRAHVLDDTKLIGIFTNGMIARRTSADCRSMAPDVLHLRRVVSGYGIITQEGRVAECRAGDLYFVDPCRPFMLGTAALHQDIEIPRAALEARVGSVRSLLGRQIPGNTPYGQLLRDFHDTLAKRMNRGDRLIASLLVPQLIDLAALAIRPHRADTMPLASRKTVDRLLLHQAIAAGATQPALTQEDIARAAGIPLSTARSLMKAEGRTIAQQILFCRLETLRKALPATRPTGLADLTEKCGFRSYQDMCSAFREFYGVSPDDYHAPSDPGSDPPTASDLRFARRMMP